MDLSIKRVCFIDGYRCWRSLGSEFHGAITTLYQRASYCYRNVTLEATIILSISTETPRQYNSVCQTRCDAQCDCERMSHETIVTSQLTHSEIV